jgi:hypothetical protein
LSQIQKNTVQEQAGPNQKDEFDYILSNQFHVIEFEAATQPLTVRCLGEVKAESRGTIVLYARNDCIVEGTPGYIVELRGKLVFAPCWSNSRIFENV